MKILHVVPSYAVNWGGPPKVVYQITEGLKEHCKVDILTSHTPGEVLVKVPDGVNYYSFKRTAVHRFWRSYAPGIKNFLEKHAAEYDIIHIHEIWLYHFFTASKISIKNDIPFIVTPHGELDAWALNYKGYKKKLFTALFQKKLLKKAAAIHVLTEKEAEEVSNYSGISRKKMFEIPNSLFDAAHKVETDSVDVTLPGDPYILFLSRINIKKGCELLLEAYSKWKFNKKYMLVFAGPAEPSSFGELLKSQVKKLGLTERVVFTGSVHGKTKQLLLQNASLFALTSYAEGFPVAILEALQAGCPLLLSNKCGIDEFLKMQGNAIVCEPTVEEILNGLDEFSQLNQLQIENIRQRGPQIINKYYSGKIVIEKYIEMYSQVLNSSGKNNPDK